jgi:DNA-directed RNA polymerase subunit M/transcription elongation factor TFIIS
MPVKVVCPSCEKVLNAPDAARGKAVRCPACETKVPVPAAEVKASAKAGAKKAPKKQLAHKDSGEFLSGLDLSKIEDDSARLCPKCGQTVTEDDQECPACGIDLSSGQIGKAALKARRGGPNQDLFYRNIWKDNWKFALKNKGLAFRTMLYCTVFFLLHALFLTGYFWCYNLPPKVFCGGLAFMALLAIPGWFWHLTVDVVHGTMAKKEKLKRVNFDFFACVALGIKFVAWQLVFFLPTYLVGGLIYWLCDRSEQPLVGAGILGVMLLANWTMFPAVLVHMSMPVQYLGWLSPKLAPFFFRTLSPNLYLSLIFVVTNLLSISGLAVTGALYGNSIAEIVESLESRSVIQRDEKYKEEHPDKNAAVLPTPAVIPDVPDLQVLIVPGILTFTSLLCFALTGTYNMRGVGQLGFYFKKDLGLISEVKEKAYVGRGPAGKSVFPEAAQKAYSGFMCTGIVNLIAVGAHVYFWVMNIDLKTEFVTEYRVPIMATLALCSTLSLTVAYLLKARSPAAKPLGNLTSVLNIFTGAGTLFAIYAAVMLSSADVDKYLKGEAALKDDDSEDDEEEEESGH